MAFPFSWTPADQVNFLASKWFRIFIFIWHLHFKWGVVKNGHFTVRLTVSVEPPHLTVSFLWFFWVVFWPQIMSICVLKWILYKKRAIFWMIICKRQEKYIVETLHNEIKCVLSVEESKFNERKIKIFTFAYGQGLGGWPPHPPLTVSLTVKYPFFLTTPLKMMNTQGTPDMTMDEDDDPDEHPGGSQAEPRLWSATR